MTTIESNNTPLPPNKRKSGRRNRKSKQSPQKEGTAIQNPVFSTPPKRPVQPPSSSCPDDSPSHNLPCSEDLIPERVGSRTNVEQTAIDNSQSKSPAMSAELLATPPSPPAPPIPPPSPPPEVFAPSKDLLDLAITGKALRPALGSPRGGCVLMLDRAQLSPGLLFEASSLPNQAFLAAQLSERPVHCSRTRSRRTAKKRGTLASIIEGEEPLSKPQFPAEGMTTTTPPARRAEEEKESGVAGRSEDEGEGDVSQREEFVVEPFTWQEGDNDEDAEDPMALDISSSDMEVGSPMSPESPMSLVLRDGCTEDEYSRFSIAADPQLAEEDVHVTPRGRRVPMFSRTPEWTDMMRLNEANMAALAEMGPVAFDLPHEPISPVLAPAAVPDPPNSSNLPIDFSPSPLLPLPSSSPSPPPSSLPLPPELLPDFPEVPDVPDLLEAVTASLSESLDFNQLNFEEGDEEEDTLPDQSTLEADGLSPQPLPRSPAKLPMSFQRPASASPGGVSPSAPFVSSPVVGSPASRLWRSPPELSPEHSSPLLPDSYSSLLPNSSSASLPNSSSSPTSLLDSPPLPEFSSSHLPHNSLRFKLPFTPVAPKNKAGTHSSPLTPATPSSPLARVDPQLLEPGVGGEEEEGDEEEGEEEEDEKEGDDEKGDEDFEIDFVYPDVSAEIQTGSDRYLMSMRALAGGCLGENTPTHGRMQSPVKGQKPIDNPHHHSNSKNNNNHNSNSKNNNHNNNHHHNTPTNNNNLNGSVRVGQLALRDQFLADPEFEDSSSVFGTMTPLSPLTRPPRMMTSPQAISPSLHTRAAASTPSFEKHLLAKKVAALEKELALRRSTPEHLTQTFEAQIKRRASETARQAQLRNHTLASS